MTDEQWLREALADAVPEAPLVPGRAQAARERAARARRRTATAALSGLAAVVAIGVVGAVAFQNDPDGSGPAGPAASDGVSPYAAPPCPPPPRPGGGVDPLDKPDQDLSDAVPAGATSVRLCQGEGTSFDVPDDALVVGADDVAASVNSLAKGPPPRTCRADMGPGYRLVFAYPDGSQFVASGHLYGCGTVVVGSGYREHAEIPFGRFTALLRTQRETAKPLPSAPARVTCDALPRSPVAQGTDLSVAALCVGNHAVPIPDDDLARLRDDMQVSRSDNDGRTCLGPPAPRIVGFSEWGDRIDLTGSCGYYSLPEGYDWTPGEEAQQILLDLTARAR